MRFLITNFCGDDEKRSAILRSKYAYIRDLDTLKKYRVLSEDIKNNKYNEVQELWGTSAFNFRLRDFENQWIKIKFETPSENLPRNPFYLYIEFKNSTTPDNIIYMKLLMMSETTSRLFINNTSGYVSSQIFNPFLFHLEDIYFKDNSAPEFKHFVIKFNSFTLNVYLDGVVFVHSTKLGSVLLEGTKLITRNEFFMCKWRQQ